MRARNIINLLCFALAIRFSYICLLVLMDGNFLADDSRMYIELATSIMQTGHLYNVEAGVLPSIARMPVYPHFLAILFELSGSVNYIAIVAAQAVIDALTVVGIALTAAAIRPSLALPVGLLGCVWPNLVVNSSFIMTDTLFVFFFTWGVCASVWALKGDHLCKLIIFSGVCFGLALMTRPVLMFFPVLLLPLLAYMLHKEANIVWYKSIAIATVPVLIMLLSMSPRLYETNKLYGKPILTTQSGIAALYWYYPCIKSTTWGCGDRMKICEESKAQERKELEKLDPVARKNPVVIDEIRKKIAIEKLRELPISRIGTGVVRGTIVGFVHTSFSLIGHQFNFKRDTILDSRYGTTAYQKMVNFSKIFKNSSFSIVWLLALAAVFISRLIQFLGIVYLYRDAAIRRSMMFILLTGLYFIVVNGPLGDAKYRLPLEPMLIIFFACGFLQALSMYRGKYRETPQP